MKLVLRLIGEAVGVAASFYAFVALIAKVLGVIGLASSSHFWTAWAMVF